MNTPKIYPAEEVAQSLLPSNIRASIVMMINRYKLKKTYICYKTDSQKNYSKALRINKSVLKELEKKVTRVNAKLTIKNAYEIMYGKGEVKSSTNLKEASLDRGMCQAYFTSLRSHRTRFYRYCVLLGKGDLVAGYDLYIKNCYEIISWINDLYYKYESFFKLAKALDPSESRVNKIVALTSTLERCSILRDRASLSYRSYKRLIRLKRKQEKSNAN